MASPFSTDPFHGAQVALRGRDHPTLSYAGTHLPAPWPSFAPARSGERPADRRTLPLQAQGRRRLSKPVAVDHWLPKGLIHPAAKCPCRQGFDLDRANLSLSLNRYRSLGRQATQAEKENDYENENESALTSPKPRFGPHRAGGRRESDSESAANLWRSKVEPALRRGLIGVRSENLRSAQVPPHSACINAA